MAHTHPKHTAEPSIEDVKIYERLKTITSALSINIVDNLVLGESEFYSAKANEIFPYNSDTDNFRMTRLD